MRAHLRLAALAIILISACTREAPPADIRAPGALAWAMAHADSAVPFVVRTVVNPDTFPPRQPHISGYPIVVRGRALSSAQIQSLLTLYTRPCAQPVETLCIFEPGFALRFFNTQLTVDILFGSGCGDSRVGGTATVSQPKGLHAFPSCSEGDLRLFFESLFMPG